MSLVAYSDSSSEASEAKDEVDIVERGVKRKRASNPDDDVERDDNELPALPSEFFDTYAVASRVGNQDDPSLHGGRKRAIPHVEGNWPTHVYLEWRPSQTESSQLQALVSEKCSDHGIRSLLTSELGTPLPLHVSLSRPIVLTTDQRNSFLSLLTSSINKSGVHPFNVSLRSLDWASNDARNRFFLVLRLAHETTNPGTQALSHLLQASNAAVERFGQPPLYTKSHESTSRQGTSRTRQARAPSPQTVDSFHISIAWTLEEPTKTGVQQAAELGELHLLEHLQDVQVHFGAVKIKIGNAVHSVDLATSLELSKGIIGS